MGRDTGPNSELEPTASNRSSQFSLSGKERLKGKKLIEALFRERNAVKLYPFIAIYKQLSKKESPVLFGVSTSRKTFKKAIQRNRIKRLIRESYRKNKYILYDQLTERDKTYAVLFLYIGKEEPLYSSIEEATKAMLHKLAKKIQP